MTYPPALDPAADALFLDFDGTLTEIVARPGEARMSDAQLRGLVALAAMFGGALAILSGRALDDLTERTSPALWRIGGHGAEPAGPGERSSAPRTPPTPALVVAAEAVARDHPGVLLEHKPNGFALHYRMNPEAGPRCVDALERAIATSPDHVLQHGKMVVEVKPKGADKGAALRRLMECAPFRGRRPVMVGDDLTDEAAMRAALDLGGLAVKVGEGDSAAPFRLSSPDAVHRWLRPSP